MIRKDKTMEGLLNLWYGTGFIDENNQWTEKALRVASKANPKGLSPVELAKEISKRAA